MFLSPCDCIASEVLPLRVQNGLLPLYLGDCVWVGWWLLAYSPPTLVPRTPRQLGAMDSWLEGQEKYQARRSNLNDALPVQWRSNRRPVAWPSPLPVIDIPCTV